MSRKTKQRNYTRGDGTPAEAEAAPAASVIDEKPISAKESGRAVVPVEWALIEGLYMPRRPQPRLDARQAQALRCAFDGMQLKGVQFNGRELRSPTEAIMVMLDRLADEMGLD